MNNSQAGRPPAASRRNNNDYDDYPPPPKGNPPQPPYDPRFTMVRDDDDDDDNASYLDSRDYNKSYNDRYNSGRFQDDPGRDSYYYDDDGASRYESVGAGGGGGVGPGGGGGGGGDRYSYGGARNGGEGADGRYDDRASRAWGDDDQSAYGYDDRSYVGDPLRDTILSDSLARERQDEWEQQRQWEDQQREWDQRQQQQQQQQQPTAGQRSQGQQQYDRSRGYDGSPTSGQGRGQYWDEGPDPQQGHHNEARQNYPNNNGAGGGGPQPRGGASLGNSRNNSEASYNNNPQNPYHGGDPSQESFGQPKPPTPRMPAGGIVSADGAYIPPAPRGSSHPRTLFNQPPTKVVKAMDSYAARFPNELSFERGDFFYVVKETDYYYEVVNPLHKVRGNVPKEFFEGLEKIAQRAATRYVDAKGLDLPLDAPPPSPQQQQRMPIPPPQFQQSQQSPYQQHAPFPFPQSGRQQQTSPQQPGLPGGGGAYDRGFGQPSDDFGTGSSAGSFGRQGGGPGPQPGMGGTPRSGPLPPSVTSPTGAGAPLPVIGYAGGGGGVGGGGGGGDRALSAVIISMERRDDGRYVFAIAVTYGEYRRSLVYRTHDDFWQLQVSLLSHFPSEAGRSTGGLPTPRRIPFMPQPLGRDVSAGRAREVRAKLDAYLRALLVELRVDRVAESGEVRKFLAPRPPADVLRYDGEATEIGDYDDLLDEYGADTFVPVRLNVGGREGPPFQVPDTVRFTDLLGEIEGRLNRRVNTIAYQDETNSFVNLCGDDDLSLLIKTHAEKLVFFPS